MSTRALLLALLALGGCARAFAPPGGERDVVPPALVSITPAALSVVAPGAGPVVIRFDERISERRFNRTMVSVTPAEPEDVRTDVSGHELRVSLEGGWRPDRVYQVLVRPGIVDLFGNERREGVELIFSTGSPPPPSALAGTLEERITRRAPANGVVEALRQSDSAVYVASADSAGFYALRHVPYGTYEVSAYADQNRNRRRDASEAAAGPITAMLGEGADTVMLIMQLLPRDSTAPQLREADRLDSLHVRLDFDDYLDPDAGFAGVGIQFLALPDSTPLPHTARVLLLQEYERERQARAAAADTAAPVRRPARPGMGAAPGTVTTRIPERTLVLELAQPLPAADVVVRVGGVRNVNNIEGGGSATAEYKPPPAPAPSPPDQPPDEPPRRP